MIISKELWRKYKNMKQELLNLKQIKKANCASKYYVKTYTPSENTPNKYQITYKAGTQPIIAEALTDGQTSLATPVGNTQYLFVYIQYRADITILSTREIESIVEIA